jgi:hypothetical protein
MGGSNSHLCVVIGLGQLTHQSWHKGVRHWVRVVRSLDIESQPMIGENRQSVTKLMNRLNLKNNRLNFNTAGNLPIILEKFIEYAPI